MGTTPAPREWPCTRSTADAYCVHHGDCTCPRWQHPELGYRHENHDDRVGNNPDCPLHGTDSTHPDEP